MKKTGLSKIIMFILLGIVVLTWIFSASYFNEGELAEMGMYNVGFFDVFQLLFSSFEFEYFLQMLVILLGIGALYGVLVKTGKYKVLVDKIANNLKGIELLFLVGIAVTIALVTSIFDYGLALLIFIPFIVSIILTMGYDRITACLATFGAMLIGTLGSTLGYNTSNSIANILDIEPTSGIIYKLVLLVLSLIALIVFLARAKRKKNVEIKESEEEVLFIGEKTNSKKSAAPIVVILCIVFVLLVLGCTKWSEVFGVSVFSELNDTITNFTVKLPYFHITTEGVQYGMEKFAIFGKLLGKTVAFGEWYYSEMAIICLIAAFILGLIYKMKAKDIFANMAYGVKKMLKPGLLVLLVYSVIYFSANTLFFPTITTHLLSIGKGFNIFFNIIVVILGSVLNVDVLYVANYMLPQMAAQNVNATVLNILTQSVYGATMFVAPTSAILAIGLCYLGVSYKDWLKKMWPLALILLVISIGVSTVALLVL